MLRTIRCVRAGRALPEIRGRHRSEIDSGPPAADLAGIDMHEVCTGVIADPAKR
jgi:hypothetical protein